MTKKRKGFWIFADIFLAIMLVLGITFLATGCDGCNQEDGGDKNEPTLSQTNVAMDVFEKVQLKVLYWDGEVIWTSGNEKIVTVSETGMVCGVSQGETKVEANLGDVQLICNITVFPNTNVPMLFVKGVESVELLAGDSYTVKPYVGYGGAKYDNATYSYSIYDTSVATVDENGTITAVAIGETKLEISANWETYENDIRLKTVLPVVVKDNLNAQILGASELNLYTYALKAYSQTFEKETQLVALVQDNGEAVASEYVVWRSSNESVATVDSDGKVVAVGAGEAEITVSYENGDRICSSNALTVRVCKPVVDITKNVPVLIDCWLDDTKTTIEYDLRTLFTDSQTSVVKVVDQDGNAVAYENGKFDKETLKTGDFVWVVENANYAIKTRAFCATKIITTAAELAQIETYGNQTFDERTITKTEKKLNEETGLEEVVETKTTYKIMYYTGYFALGNDITFKTSDDYNGKSYIQWKDSAKSTLKKVTMHMGSTQYDDVGFSGVFEGMGHTISNVKLGRGGLFGTISKNGTVRNFKVENASLQENNASVIAVNLSGVVENVEIEVDQNAKKNASPLAYLAYNATLRNVKITTSDVVVADDGAYGTVVYWTKGGCVVENVSVNKIAGARIVGSDGSKIGALITVRGEIDVESNDKFSDDQIWE